MNNRITLSCTMQNFFCLFVLYLGVLSNLVYCKPQDTQPPFKYVLENGLTILVKKVENNLPVAVQLWINAGSKDEPLEHKGDAHLLEHLLFKGTQRMSERDIILIGKKFSGSWNAFTHYDFTAMVLDFPKEYWKVGIPILADCLTNCTLRQEVLNSELKAVIQEFKMGKDNTGRALFEATMTHLFPAYHPYHHSVIGYKHDLYKVDSKRVREFYQKYYVPNNVALVVVGNVDEQEVVELAQQHFGALEAKPVTRPQVPMAPHSIKAQSVKLYRDIEKPIVLLAFKIPGAVQRALFVDDILHVMLTRGESSRLYKKLVDELRLVSSVSSSSYNLVESDVLVIVAELLHAEDIDAVVSCVKQELEKVIEEGPSQEEIERYKAMAVTGHRHLLQDNYSNAETIGLVYTIFNDETRIYDSIKFNLIPADISDQIKQFVKIYLRPSSLLKVVALPFLDQADKDAWRELQKKSDLEDTKILNAMYRELALEEGKYVHELEFKQENIESIEFPIEMFTLKNGLKVIYHKRSDSDLVHCGVYLKTFDSQEAHEQRDALSCLNNLVSRSGTQNHTAAEITEKLTHLNFAGSVGIGRLIGSFPAENFTQIVTLLVEEISKHKLDESKLAQIIDEIEASNKNTANEPAYKLMQSFDTALYGSTHPLGVEKLTDVQVLKELTLDKLNELHKQHVTPQEATMVLVGDIPVSEDSSLQELLEELCQSWQGTDRQALNPIKYPEVSKPAASKTINAQSLRDQVHLVYGTLSIEADHPDYCPLRLYNTHLKERLFRLREKTGIFYTIYGDMLNDSAKEHPGKALIITIVSPDRLCEVKELLRKFIVEDINAFNDSDLEEAKAAIREDYKLLTTTAQGAFGALSHIAQEDESLDFYTKRLKKYESIKLEDVKRIVREIFKPEHMITVQVGRIADEHIACQATVEQQNASFLVEESKVVLA